MKIFFFTLATVLVSTTALTQQVSDLTVTLPTGKVITFQTAEQKAKFEASVARVSANAYAVQQAERQRRLAEAMTQEREKAKEKMLEKQATEVSATIQRFTIHGVIADMDLLYPSTSEFGSRIWKSCGGSHWLAYVDLDGEKLVAGETVRLTVYEFDRIKIGGDYYRFCTTNKNLALQAYTDWNHTRFEGLPFPHELAAD